MAHRESDGEVVSVRVGSKMIGNVQWWTVKRKTTCEREYVKLVTKMRRKRHLQMRRGTAELLGETSTAINHRSGRISTVNRKRGGGRA